MWGNNLLEHSLTIVSHALHAVLPKQGSVFVFAVPAAATASLGDGGMTVLDGPHVEFDLYGNQFCFRAVDRAGRKFKHKESIEL